MRNRNEINQKELEMGILNVNNKNSLEDIKRLLIIVDMVNGFVKEGAMADPYIAHIIDEQLKLINMFKGKDDKLAFIRDCHKEECTEFKKFPMHCLEKTSESELVDELKPFEKDGLVYKKNSTSTMFATNFVSDIERLKNLKEVVITGCCTDICVMNLAIPLVNYFDELNREVEIVVPTNAVETYDSPLHSRDEYNEMAFKFMNQAGIKLVKKYERGSNYGK